MKYVHYMKLTPNELHNKLLKRKLPEATMDEIKRIIQQQKDDLKSKTNQTTQLVRYWTPIMYPLLQEIKSCRAMLKYKASPERDEAVRAYMSVLLKLRDKFNQIERQHKETPMAVAKELNIINHGIHWTDWIPDNVKAKITALFTAIPHAPKAKRKIPFERVIPQKMAVERKDALYKRTDAELDKEQRLQRTEPTEERALYIGELKVALNKIYKLKLNEPIPNTWRQLP